MNALTQYIDLFRQNRAAIDAHSAPALNAARTAALALLEKVGRLPDRGDEGFEKTSVNDMFAPDFGVNIERRDLPADVAASFRCGVPNLSTLLGLVVNDRFAATPALLKNLPDGVDVCSLAQAVRQWPDFVADYYAKLSSASQGTSASHAALNTLLCQGVYSSAWPPACASKKPYSSSTSSSRSSL